MSIVVWAMMALGGDAVAAIIDSYRARTQAERRCNSARLAEDIVVCSARDADRYRLPLIAYDAGDPRAEGVLGEHDRWIARPTPCQSHGPYLVGCGAVGVTGSVSFGAGGTGTPRLRGFAP